MELHDEVTIDAPAATVWTLTVDIEGWPKVTPTVASVSRLDDAPLDAGSRARVKQPRQPPAVWVVTRFEPETLFEWSAQSLGMAMVATHRIVPLDERRCRNLLTLTVNGPTAALFGRLLKPHIAKVLATENASFKRAAESAAP